MATFLRILRLYALAAWVGGLVFFVVVAAIAFKYLPDAHTAGIVVRNSLLDIHRIGIAAAVVYILATLALLALQRDSHPARAAELALAAVMLSLTLYSQLSIMPRMDTDRLTLGGDVLKASADAPARRDFDRLHARSVHLEMAVLIEGLILLGLAPIHGKTDFRY
jgi:cytochrome bd-type quinol oxidase subunit 2